LHFRFQFGLNRRAEIDIAGGNRTAGIIFDRRSADEDGAG